MTWWFPGLLFTLILFAVMVLPSLPARWFESVLNFFGIGNVNAKRAATFAASGATVSAWTSSYLLVHHSTMSAPWVWIDICALACAGGLVAAWVASRTVPERGSGIGE